MISNGKNLQGWNRAPNVESGALKNKVSNNTGAFALELLGAELPRPRGGRPRQFCPLSPIVRAALVGRNPSSL